MIAMNAKNQSAGAAVERPAQMPPSGPQKIDELVPGDHSDAAWSTMGVLEGQSRPFTRWTNFRSIQFGFFPSLGNIRLTVRECSPVVPWYDDMFAENLIHLII